MRLSTGNFKLFFLSEEVKMTAREANNAPVDSAQPAFTDPLIASARLVNFAAEIERNLAMRRAMRPRRSEAARKGWEARRV